MAMSEVLKPLDVFLGEEWNDFYTHGMELGRKYTQTLSPDPDELETDIENMYTCWEAYKLGLEKYLGFIT